MSQHLIEYSQLEVLPENALEVTEDGVLQKRAQNDLVFLAHFDYEDIHVKEEVSQRDQIAVINILNQTPPAYPAGNPAFAKCLRTYGNVQCFAMGTTSFAGGKREIHASFYVWFNQTTTGGVAMPLLSMFKTFTNDQKTEVFKIEWINADLKFSVRDNFGNLTAITASSVLTTGGWLFVECYVYDDSVYMRPTIKVDGDIKATGIMTAAASLPGATDRAVVIAFDVLGNNQNRYFYMEEVAIKQNAFQEVITAPRTVFTVGEIVSKWFGDTELDGTIWKPDTLYMVGNVPPELDWRIAAATSKTGIVFTGNKVDFDELQTQDDVTGRWSGLEITFPGGDVQHRLPVGKIEYDPPDVSEFYSSPEEVVHRTGVKYEDLGADNEDDMLNLITSWLVDATDYINKFTGQVWTSVTVPQAVESACAGMVSTQVVICQQRRKSPLIKISDFNIKMIEDDVVTDDVIKVLKKYVDSTSFVGVSLGVDVDEDDSEE
jgi:hypothetical protein